jgi:GxxExxY protein
MQMMSKQMLDDLEYVLTGAVIAVHKNLGPGLLESVYHKCLAHELGLRELQYTSQLTIPIPYKGITIDAELRPDFVVEDCTIIEIKAVEAILPIHEAQLLTYMKLLEIPKGLLVNFNCINIIKSGKKAFVNEYYRQLL